MQENIVVIPGRSANGQDKRQYIGDCVTGFLCAHPHRWEVRGEVYRLTGIYMSKWEEDDAFDFTLQAWKRHMGISFKRVACPC